MRIYISGAITGTEDFRERFLKAEKELIAVGHDTVNPARLNDIMPKDATHEEYMRMSFELLDICDAIYMLEGWESSKGANQEYGFAKGKGTAIYEVLKMPTHNGITKDAMLKVIEYLLNLAFDIPEGNEAEE